MLAKNCGSVTGRDLVRQKDGKFERVRYGPVAITALSKDNYDGVLVRTSRRAHSFMKTRSELGPAFTASISLAETATARFGWAQLGDGLFLLRGGASNQVNAGLHRPKDQLSAGRSVVTSCGRHPTRACIAERQRLSSLELPSFLGIVQVLSLLRDRDSNIWVGTTRGLCASTRKAFRSPKRMSFAETAGLTSVRGPRGNLWIEVREG